MDVLDQRKREIEQQCATIRASFMSERKLLSNGAVSLAHLLDEKPTGSQTHILEESRKVLQEHSTSSSRGRYLGKLRIFTPDGAQILPCSCAANTGSQCDNMSHDEKPRSNRQGEEDIKYEKSLASVRSEKGLHRWMRDQASVRSGGKPPKLIEPMDGPIIRSSGLLQDSELQSDPYGFLSTLMRNRTPAAEQQIHLKGRVTQNYCSFCLKKCNSLTCQSCQRLKLRR